jgi:hypothetical protein
VFVDVEGWLEVLVTEKKEEGANTEQIWVPFWFALLTKESDGLVDSRSLQYSSSPGDEPDHAIPLPAARTLEPCVLDDEGRFDSNLTTLQLEARDCTFSLTVPPPPHAPSVGEHVYVFTAKDSATAAAWICALGDESNASPFRRSAPAAEEICFLSAARAWMAEVFSVEAPHKVQVCLMATDSPPAPPFVVCTPASAFHRSGCGPYSFWQDIDAMLEEWMGEELELLETVAAKYVCGIPRSVQSLAAVAHDKLQHRRAVAAAAAEKLIVKQENHTPETPTPRFRLRIIVVEEGVADLQITYE